MTKKHASAAELARPHIPQSPFDAFKAVVYRHGVEAMAAKLGYRVGTLYNKCDAGEETHAQPTLRDVVLATSLTGDVTILESLDRLFDRTGLELGPLKVTSDAALLELLCKVGTEQGELYGAVNCALANGRFDKAEYQAIRMEAFDLVRAVMAFVDRVGGLVDD